MDALNAIMQKYLHNKSFVVNITRQNLETFYFLQISKNHEHLSQVEIDFDV